LALLEPIEATIPASSAQAIARRLRLAGRPACALTRPRITLRGQWIPEIGCIGVGAGCNRARKATPQFS